MLLDRFKNAGEKFIFTAGPVVLVNGFISAATVEHGVVPAEKCFKVLGNLCGRRDGVSFDNTAGIVNMVFVVYSSSDCSTLEDTSQKGDYGERVQEAQDARSLWGHSHCN